jgi:hypothetical protein
MPRRSWLVILALMTTVAAMRTTVVRGQGDASPQTWVPLVADYEASGPDSTVRGTLWRSADGSIRLEIGAGLTAPHIQIRNVSRNIFYEFRALAGWTSLPLGDRRPALAREDAAGKTTSMMFEGRAAERRESPDGRMDVVVPELNSLTVERSLPDGSRVALRNVRTDVALGAALFEPPAGAFVRWLGPGPPAWQRREFRGDELRDLPGHR